MGFSSQKQWNKTDLRFCWNNISESLCLLAPFSPLQFAFFFIRHNQIIRIFVRITPGKGIDQTQQNYNSVKLKYFVFCMCVLAICLLSFTLVKQLCVASGQKNVLVEREGLIPLQKFKDTVKNLGFCLQKYKCLKRNKNLT